MKKKILVAAAWPYANGSLHMGHVAALLGSDILARYHRLNGDQVLFVSGSDCHGTPIAVEADCQGIPPAEIADKYHQEFKKNLIDDLKFSYDCYTTTTTETHKEVVQQIFLKLFNEGYVYKRTEDLPYCLKCQRFLPDRYIEGECPFCHFKSARGDQCDGCGRLLDPNQFTTPRCKICGERPEWRPSEHFFFRLSRFESQIKDLVEKGTDWRPNARNFTLRFLQEGLKDRAITRDTTWGVPIPLPGYGNKRIYVWFEAVCGYLSASQEWAKSKGKPDLWQEFWQNKAAIHYYFHGKDNIPFHTVVWPAILFAYGGLHLPDRIYSSEYMLLEGKQFSKSRHWALWLPDFLKKFDPEALRYYLVANGPETADADFSWREFRKRTNNELIGNFGNFFHRVLSFSKKSFPDGAKFPEKFSAEQSKLLDVAKKSFAETGEAIEKGQFRKALRAILSLAEHGNRYIDTAAPWASIKTDPTKTEADLAVAGQAIRCLAILIYPFLPQSAEKVFADIGLKADRINWEYPAAEKLVVEENLKPLYRRIEEAEIQVELDQLKNVLK